MYLRDLATTNIYGSSISLKAICELEHVTIFTLYQESVKPIIWQREWDVKKLGIGEWDDPIVYLYRSLDHYEVMGPAPPGNMLSQSMQALLDYQIPAKKT